MWEWVLLAVIAILLLASLKIVNQYERGVKFRLGKFAGTLDPGLNIVIPVLEELRTVDLRVLAVDVPPQEGITKDNIPLKVNAVSYFRVVDPDKAILNVENYSYAVSQYSQSTLRSVIGQFDLDDLLEKREAIGEEIKKILDKVTGPWGMDVISVEVKDVEMPEEMKRAMAKQAEAERERKAKVIMSQGELQASENIANAANILNSAPGGFHLRTLETVAEITPEKNWSIITLLPSELLEALDSFAKSNKGKK